MSPPPYAAALRRALGLLGLALAALAMGACGGGDERPPPKRPKADQGPATPTLRGMIDMRPFGAVAAFARRRPDNDVLDIMAYERHVELETGCNVTDMDMLDGERRIFIQMHWPVAIGSELMAAWDGRGGPVDVSFIVRRDRGTASQPAGGTILVQTVSPTGGLLFINMATPNVVGGVQGATSGGLPFIICR